MQDDLATQAASVGALAEPARYALYRYVAGQSEPVSREQAAASVDLPLHSAKFHLDQLVERGLLEVEFRRLSGRTGPGAGRPSKLYRRSAQELSVSLPARRYELAAAVLAASIERAADKEVPVRAAVRTTARAEGRRLANDAGREMDHDLEGKEGTSPSDSSAGSADLKRMARLLVRHGYEPKEIEGEICLANCPFDQMAAEHTELICGMNLALIRGALDGLRARGLTATLAPREGFCCVRIAGP